MAIGQEISSPADTAMADSFRRTVLGLLAKGELRGDRLTHLCQQVLAHSQNSQWPTEFQWLLFMPRFLNICLVQGSCNGDCRMCSAGRNVPFTHLTAHRYRQILDHIPTADGITFSAGDCDPLMNPDLPEILAETGRRGLQCDFFTNGLALTQQLIGNILDSGAVSMINVSLDACTPETYTRIRRRNLAHVQAHIAAMQEEKRRRRVDTPRIALSLVAMEDNIEELPGLVDYAAACGAFMVYVENLIGEHVAGDENQPATKNPRCLAAVAEACQRAAAYGLIMELPPSLRANRPGQAKAESDPALMRSVQSDIAALNPGNDTPSILPVMTGQDKREPPAPDMPGMDPTCCTWLRGVWIRMDGGMSACCLNHAIDLGHVTDGKLWENQSYLLAKMRLFSGKIYPSCIQHHRNCPYTQSLLDHGVRLADYMAPARTEESNR